MSAFTASAVAAPGAASLSARRATATRVAMAPKRVAARAVRAPVSVSAKAGPSGEVKKVRIHPEPTHRGHHPPPVAGGWSWRVCLPPSRYQTHRKSKSTPTLTLCSPPRPGGARVLRRSRHLHHPQVASGYLRLRGRHLHRRPRPGRVRPPSRARDRTRTFRRYGPPAAPPWSVAFPILEARPSAAD